LNPNDNQFALWIETQSKEKRFDAIREIVLAKTLDETETETEAEDEFVEEEEPEQPQKPWHAASADAVHPYHVILSERLYQKLDWVWKRKDFRSMRDLVMQTLEAEADKALKEMGEQP
jgi:hypothetical protein